MIISLVVHVLQYEISFHCRKLTFTDKLEFFHIVACLMTYRFGCMYVSKKNEGHRFVG